MGGIEFKLRKIQFVILSQMTMNLGTLMFTSFKGSWRDIEKYLCANIQWPTLNSRYPAAKKQYIIYNFLMEKSSVFSILMYTVSPASLARLPPISVASILITNLCLDPRRTLNRVTSSIASATEHPNKRPKSDM